MFSIDRFELLVGMDAVEEHLRLEAKEKLRCFDHPRVQQNFWKDGGGLVHRIWINFKSKIKGHGRTGQVKAASFGSRSITLSGQKLNRGSAIDFINSFVENYNSLKRRGRIQCSDRDLEKLDKGNFLFGGDSDEVIKGRFDRICVEMTPDVLKKLREEADSFSRIGLGLNDARASGC